MPGERLKGLRMLLVAGALCACSRDRATYTIASASPWNEAYGLMSPQITVLSAWLFRFIPSDSANGQDLARFASSLGHKRAAILYENNSYGRGLADSFRRAFRGEIASLEPVAVDGKEVEPYLAYLKLHEPGLIFVAGSDGSGLEILREARRQGIRSEFLGGDGWAGVTADTATAEGVYVGAPFSADDPRPEVAEFVRAFRAKFGRDPNSFAALAYDATMVIAQAIERAGPDRAAIRDYLGSMQEADAYQGLTGRIVFQQTGDV